MPMIVYPSAPPVTMPSPAVSLDGWLTATLDTTYAGIVLDVDYTAGTPLADAADVRKVRITRLDPGGVPSVVRSADQAWAVGGVGVAYDHEAPLGVAVAYQAVPEFADGTTGPTSSVSVALADPVAPLDVWIKSIDTPGLSALVTVTAWPQLQWAARVDRADVTGSRYPGTAQDVYGASTSEISIDAVGDAIETVRELLTTPGVRLLQTRSDYHRPDQYAVFGDVTEGIQATPTGGRTFTAGITEVERPDTAGQPLRMPDWSYDAVAGAYATYDAVEAAYSSFASLATNGVA
ncbi:hypothetical protein [Streptomyces stelliscabiei]|uniref:hypothetical protein n=1 Tax=Streptomyces stelliscabiei TaxID=146820 RepID=UPI002FF35929